MIDNRRKGKPRIHKCSTRHWRLVEHEKLSTDKNGGNEGKRYQDTVLINCTVTGRRKIYLYIDT